jgi:hypothetical protein
MVAKFQLRTPSAAGASHADQMAWQATGLLEGDRGRADVRVSPGQAEAQVAGDLGWCG